jgi:ferredoxin
VKYKIEIERGGCIACGACYDVNPSHFEPDSEGKSSVIGGETDSNLSSGVFDDKEIENVRDAEDSCPVSIITVNELKKR